MYQDTNYFDEYIIHDNIMDSIQKLRKIEFDIIINLQCNKPSHYTTMFLKKKKVINFSKSLYQKLFFIKTKNKSLKEIIELSKINLNLVENYFINFEEFVDLPVKEVNFFEKKDRKIIAISTGTSERWISKRWGLENYNELISLLKDKYKVVLIGSELELMDEKYILKNNPSIKSFVNKTNLTQLKGLLYSADLFVGNDSGPAHIAAGVGTQTITIFGSTDSKHSPKFMKYRGKHGVLIPSKEVKCHPCYKTKCPFNMECMKSISVESVYKKIENLLISNK